MIECSEKDMRKEVKEDDVRPKRQRGRPRKVKIVSDDLVMNSDNNEEESDSISDEEENQDYTS